MTRRLTLAAILVGCAIPALALWLSVGVRAPTQQELLLSDLPWYFTPTFAVLHRALTEGFFPLWNPWQLAGWPFLAAFQTQTLYLPAWAVAWLPPHLAITVYGVMHWVFAFVGMVLLAGRLGIGREGAMAGAIVYALSGPVADAFFVHSATLAVLSWVPWVTAAAVALVRARDAGPPLVVFALAVAASLLAGAPEHFLYLAMSVLIVAGWQASGNGMTGIVRGGGRLLAGFALAALFAAAQILPTLELMQRAVRSVDSFSAEYVARFPMSPDLLLRSYLLGGKGSGGLTVLLLPLAVAALCQRRTRRPAIFLAGVAALTLDYLRGNDGWTFPLFYAWVPFAHAFRTHLRATLVWAVFGALVAALGVDALNAMARSRLQRGAVVMLALLALLFAESATRSLPDRVFVPLQEPAALYGPPGLEKAVEEIAGPERVFVDYGAPGLGLQHKFGEMHGVRQVGEYDALVPRQYPRLFDVPEGTPWMGRLSFASRTKQDGGANVTIPGVPLAALDVLATRYYLAAAGPRAQALGAYVDGTTRYRADYTVVERSKARPRTWLVHEAVAVADAEEAVRRLRSPGFDVSRIAIVEGAAPELDPPEAGGEESATIAADEPNRVLVDAVCSSRCLLVLADLAYPGWRATVDGTDATILTADYLLRAIALRPGRHRISFEYRPMSWIIGVGVSLTALLSAFAYLSMRVRRHATGTTPPGPAA